MDSESDDELYNAVGEYETDDYSEVSYIVLYNAMSEYEKATISSDNIDRANG